jgi:Glycosyltransferase
MPRRAASRHVDQVIGVSQHILDRHLREGCFPQAAHSVIPNTCRLPDDRSLLARTSAGARRIGFLGRLVREKGVEELLRAWSRLPLRAGIELHIAGTGTADYLAALRALAGDRADVHWRGFVAADAFLDDIDLLVVPSLWEDPAPLVVQEALARRVPVLGAARGGIPELLGNPVMQFEPLDPDELASRLAALIDGPLPAPQTDLAQWSSASVLDRTEAAYHTAVARHGAATGH